MDPDEFLPKKSGNLLSELMRQDLDPLSVAELEERIAALEAEIARRDRKCSAPLITAQAPISYSNDERRALR